MTRFFLVMMMMKKVMVVKTMSYSPSKKVALSL
jgi:hypothetical protein